MNTREEINRRTRLPRNEKKVEFVRVQRPKSNRGHYSGQAPVLHGRNTHLFEDVQYSGGQSLEDDDGPNEAEITADILQMNGGPIATNAVIEKNWRDRVLSRELASISLESVINSSWQSSSISSLTSCSTSPTSSASSRKNPNQPGGINKKNEYITPSFTEQTDDGDFYYLQNTTRQNRKSNDDDYHFDHRSKKTIITPRNYLLETVTDDMFEFNKP